MSRSIVVVVTLPAPVELVWDRTQTPVLHVAWDIRFTHIANTDIVDERGYYAMDYRTSIGFGMEIKGFGHYLHSTPLRHSTFEFDSNDWKSLITRGRGIWQYTPVDGESRTHFKTVYDYQVRFGLVGRIIDALVFRRLLQLATEWGFETLRLWCEGDEGALKRRNNRLRFFGFFLARLFGKKPTKGEAVSWLGRPDDPPSA